MDGTALAGIVARSLPNESNGFALLTEPTSALQSRLALIELAQRTLDLQYFIWKSDATGRLLMAGLRDAALRGVRVRLLLDDLYTAETDALLEALSGYPNVEIRLFNPFPAGRSSFASRLLTSLGDLDRVRHRMHNKLFVADNMVAITGGRNVGDSYLAAGRANVFDMDILAAGPAVREMSNGFDDYWNSDLAYEGALLWGHTAAADRRETFTRLLNGDVSGLAPENSVLLAAQLRQPPATAELADGRLALQVCDARVFADPVEKAAGTGLEDSSATLHQRLIQAFSTAQEEISIVSPYFVRGQTGLQRIQALVERGVRLRVLTNSLSSTDEPLAHIVYLRYRRALLQLGVELREFAGPRADHGAGAPADAADVSSSGLHAKAAVIDRRWLYVGSLNFTSRSERVNTELGLILDCPVLARQVLDLVNRAPAYELRLNQNRAGIEWVDRRRTPEQVWSGEPNASLWQRLKSVLLNPFVPEQEI